jgi:hypothetical protein
VWDGRERKLVVGEPRSVAVDIPRAEDRDVPPEHSHGESALLRLAERAEEFDAEQVAAAARAVAETAANGCTRSVASPSRRWRGLGECEKRVPPPFKLHYSGSTAWRRKCAYRVPVETSRLVSAVKTTTGKSTLKVADSASPDSCRLLRLQTG